MFPTILRTMHLLANSKTHPCLKLKCSELSKMAPKHIIPSNMCSADCKFVANSSPGTVIGGLISPTKVFFLSHQGPPIINKQTNNQHHTTNIIKHTNNKSHLPNKKTKKIQPKTSGSKLEIISIYLNRLASIQVSHWWVPVDLHSLNALTLLMVRIPTPHRCPSVPTQRSSGDAATDATWRSRHRRCHNAGGLAKISWPSWLKTAYI